MYFFRDEKLKAWIKNAELNLPKRPNETDCSKGDQKNNAMHTLDVQGDLDAGLDFDM